MDRIWSAQRYPLSPTDRVYGPQGYAAPSASHADIVASIPAPTCAVTASVAPTSGSTAAITGLVPGPTSAVAASILIQASFSGGSPAPTSVVHVSSSGADSEIDMFDSIPAPVSSVGVNLRSVASILELMPAPVSAVTATNAPATDEEGDWFDSIPSPTCQITASQTNAVTASINAQSPAPTSQITSVARLGAFITTAIPAPTSQISANASFAGTFADINASIGVPQIRMVGNMPLGIPDAQTGAGASRTQKRRLKQEQKARDLDRLALEAIKPKPETKPEVVVVPKPLPGAQPIYLNPTEPDLSVAVLKKMIAQANAMPKGPTHNEEDDLAVLMLEPS